MKLYKIFIIFFLVVKLLFSNDNFTDSHFLNNDFLLDSWSYQEWQVNKWNDSRFMEYYYNNDNSLAESILYKVNENNKEPYEKDSYQYSNGKIISLFRSEYESLEWINKTKNDYEYNKNDSLLKVYDYYWFNSNWSLYRITDYQYYPSNLISKMQNFSVNNSVYSLDYEETYSYNDKFLLDILEIKEYNNGKLESISQQSYNYDSYNRIIEELVKKFVDNNFVNIERFLHSYIDINKNEIIIQDWVNNNWVNITKIEFFYDNKNQLVNEKRYNWKSNSWSQYFDRKLFYDDYGNNIEDFLRSSSNGSEFRNEARYKYTFDRILSGTDINGNLSINIFPNPCFNYITLIGNVNRTSDGFVSLFTVDGLLLKCIKLDYIENIGYNLKIDLNNFSSGVYFYKVQIGDYLDNGKFVVIKY